MVVLWGSSSAGAAANDTLRLGIISDLVMHLPLFVAEDGNLFAEEKVTVKRETKYGKFRTSASLLNNEIDLILQSTEGYFELADIYGSKEYKIIGGIAATSGSAVVSRLPMPNTGFSWNHLRQKRFLGRDRNSTPMYFLRSVLVTNGVDPTNVKFNTTAPVPARVRIWNRKKSHDYGIFYEPDVSTIIRTGNGYFAAMLGPSVGKIDSTVFIVKTAFLKSAKNRDLVQRFANAMQRALNITAQSSLASLLPITKRHVVDRVRGKIRFHHDSDLEESIKRYRSIDFWKTDLRVAPRALTEMQRLIIESGGTRTKRHRCYDDVVDMRFAEAALAKYPTGKPVGKLPGSRKSADCG